MNSALVPQPTAKGETEALVGAKADRPSRRRALFAGGGGATLLLAFLVCAAIAWMALDVAPRFHSAPLRLPLQHTIWDPYSTPRQAARATGPPVELGIRLRPSVAGKIIGLRFYKIAGDSGPHTGTLWTGKGKPLATVTFTDETPSGWQEALFAAPVPVGPGRLLVASYLSPAGGGAFGDQPQAESEAAATSASPAFQRPPVKDGPTSVYHLGGKGFPDTDADSQAVWVDVVFVPETSG